MVVHTWTKALGFVSRRCGTQIWVPCPFSSTDFEVWRHAFVLDPSSYTNVSEAIQALFKTCLKVSSCWLNLCSAYEHSFGSLAWFWNWIVSIQIHWRCLGHPFRNRDCFTEVVPMLQTSVYSFRKRLKKSGLATLGLSCFLRTGGISFQAIWIELSVLRKGIAVI